MRGLDLFGKPENRQKSSTVCGGFLSIIAIAVSQKSLKNSDSSDNNFDKHQGTRKS